MGVTREGVCHTHVMWGDRLVDGCMMQLAHRTLDQAEGVQTPGVLLPPDSPQAKKTGKERSRQPHPATNLGIMVNVWFVISYTLASNQPHNEGFSKLATRVT